MPLHCGNCPGNWAFPTARILPVFAVTLPRMMSAVDIVAHTSTSPEPFGRVIVEAMLARKPVIATAAGGAAEIISHGHDGVLVPAVEFTTARGGDPRSACQSRAGQK